MQQGVLYLEGSFEVCLDSHPAGKVEIIRQGLYCRVVCRCHVPLDTVYRLYGVSEKGEENLGVVMPEGDGFLLDRRLPAKRLEGCTRFLLSDGSEAEPMPEPEEKTKETAEEAAGEEAQTGTFVPICPEEPFSYLHQLESAYLEEQNGQIGAHIQENPGTA